MSMPVPKEMTEALTKFMDKQKKGNKIVLIQMITISEKFNGYCVKCKDKTEIKKPVLVISERGPAMIHGDCAICKTGMARIAPKRVYERWNK